MQDVALVAGTSEDTAELRKTLRNRTDTSIEESTFPKAVLKSLDKTHQHLPPGVLKSIIFGNLRRYWQQNTSLQDYVAIARQFAERLEARGHARSTIDELFMEAAKAFTNKAPTRPKTAESPLYLHWEWHPRGLTRQLLRQAYNEHLQGHDGFDRLIIAYARPQNLRDSLTSSRLDEPPGQNASDLIRTFHECNT
jgi:hypothetical protein